MKGVIIGTGSWKETARATAEQAARMTGLEFEVLDTPWVDVPHPSWLKLFVAERVKATHWLIMDADMIPLKPWNPLELLGDYPLAMARDRLIPSVVNECRKYGLRQDLYTNGGLMIFDKRGAEILAEAKKYLPAYGSWMEQTGVNAVCQHHLCRDKVRLIPQAYNRVCFAEDVIAKPQDFRHAVNVHVVALKNDLAKFARAKAALDRA